MVTKQDDEDLIYFFKNFETIITGDKKNTDWAAGADFQCFRKYLIDDIRGIRTRLKNPDDKYLYYVSEHIFNIIDWIKLMVEDAGFPTFATAWETEFDKHFGDKDILRNIYSDCFEKWISNKEGQYQIGTNFYNILHNKLYYHNRFGDWFEAEKATAFDLKPSQQLVKDNHIIEKLNGRYKETWYDSILNQWNENKYKGELPKDFLIFNNTETSPEEYSEFTFGQIETLLKTPVSIAELERWNGGEIVELEHLVKLSAFILETVRKRINENSHTLFLLRDCLMFYEAEKIIDNLEGKNSSYDEILVGRKLLSHKPGAWGYYVVTLEALYTAHMRYPDDFTDFYTEYKRLLDLSASLNPKFAEIITDIAVYIKNHIQTDKKDIIVFDIGFQGSIALLTKYIIDKHIYPSRDDGDVKTDIKVGIGSQWSKKLFGHRYDGDYFPMLNRVQLMTRSNELYHYKEGSLKSGKIQVIMGEKLAQQKSALELAVLVMVAQLTQVDN